MTGGQLRTYREVLTDDAHLAMFLRNMSKFDRQFCESMGQGADFTLRLEVHGAKGKLNHIRVHSDVFERPEGAPRRKKRRKSTFEDPE